MVVVGEVEGAFIRGTEQGAAGKRNGSEINHFSVPEVLFSGRRFAHEAGCESAPYPRRPRIALWILPAWPPLHTRDTARENLRRQPDGGVRHASLQHHPKFALPRIQFLGVRAGQDDLRGKVMRKNPAEEPRDRIGHANPPP